MTTESDRLKVAVFTGTRAEYGLLVPILRRLEQSSRIDSSLIVAGSHLSLLHGMTIDAVEADGFVADERVEMVLANDSVTAVTKSLGLGLIEMAGTLDRLRPDLLVLVGDRYEVLAAATAALVAGVPIAHIHGGEITEGAFDDSIRHAVTKLSHLHFVATEEFAKRVRQLGEAPERVHVVGALAMDVITSMRISPRAELARRLGVDVVEPLVLVVYHPSTIPGEDPLRSVNEVLAAVEALDEGTIVCSLPNADPLFSEVRDRIQQFADATPRAVAVSSLGHQMFLSLLHHASVLVGNSSSGIIEAPSVGTPTVNVGQRQTGRPTAASITTVEPRRAEILAATREALSPEGQTTAREAESPYDLGVSAASVVVDVIESTDLAALVRKTFSDLA